MQTLRQALVCAALMALVAFLVALTATVCVIASVAQQLPKQLDAALIETRGQLLAQVADAEHGILAHLDKLESRADSRLGSIQADVNLKLTRALDVADARLGDTLGKVDQALAEVNALRLDAQPILENASQITAHANEASAILFARNALPAQILGLTAASKVAAGEVAQTMKVVRDSAPAIAASTIDTADSVRGVAADIHTVTSSYLKPPTFWGRVWAIVKTGGILYVRTL